MNKQDQSEDIHRDLLKLATLLHRSAELSAVEGATAMEQSGASDEELQENSVSLSGDNGSPTLDGQPHSPERANVNAMREALEAQAEFEVGKPIAEKVEEIEHPQPPNGVIPAGGSPIIVQAPAPIIVQAPPAPPAAAAPVLPVRLNERGEALVTVQFKLNGKLHKASFSTPTIRDTFEKEAAQKFGSKIEFLK